MASSLGFVEFVMGQIEGVGALRHRKMFGEYCVYVNEKPIVLVCDDRVYVAMAPELKDIMAGAEKGFPYAGAKERYVLDVDDRELMREAVGILDAVTPVPRKKRTKRS